MLYRKPRVGHEINSYCGKCKIERTHIVAAMDGEVVRKVTCGMCGGTHNYRVESGPKRQTGTGSRRARPAEQPFAVDPTQPVKAYDIRESFSEGDVIKHSKFGIGSVAAVTMPNKIEVRFQDGKKILLHNMSAFGG